MDQHTFLRPAMPDSPMAGSMTVRAVDRIEIELDGGPANAIALILSDGSLRSALPLDQDGAGRTTMTSLDPGAELEIRLGGRVLLRGAAPGRPVGSGTVTDPARS